MPKSQMNNRLSASVLDARAGLIPASDDIEDELNARAARIRRVVKVYARRTDGRDDLAIIDILHGLRHYCDRKALAFDELDKAAYGDYREYVDESPWISRMPSSGDG
jgi:hypothetical protein